MASLFIYDVSDDKARNRIAKLLLRCGFIRVQKSVFLGQLDDALITDMAAQARKLLDAVQAPSDSLILLDVSSNALDDMRVVGIKPNVDLILRRLNTWIV